ncbi:peroxidase P7-like [Phoenix dactylifera]|uniref:Peroxidase n=1 Tax=Phoenix dactylifera TaxID=42345 RepID=A0A8B7BPA7_PHODC|nr:peroxidase P7-like [Phoenix dactylifera]
MASLCSFLTCLAVILASLFLTRAQLDPHYYDKLCPEAVPTIRMMVEQAVAREPRMGASLLRLHFHDCFVNGCDGSILLDDTPTFTGEKTAAPNNNSVRGFDVVDSIKAAVNAACHGNVVSCADILAVAARDSVVALGGPSYEVQVGRRDSRTASKDAANNNIPAPTLDFSALLSNFQSHGLSMKDLVVLSGGHTIGLARCTSFRSRLYNETATMDAALASTLKPVCPSSGGDNNLAPLDETPTRFDGVYFKGLLKKKGLLHSDQQLFKGDGSSGSDGLVLYYSKNPHAFWEDFGVSMIKMGSMSPLTGPFGEIRMNCRKVN